MAAQESRVLEVMQVGNRRIVVLTETHVALMRVRVAAVRSVYRAMWKVRLTKIQTVRGASSQFCLSHGLLCHLMLLVSEHPRPADQSGQPKEAVGPLIRQATDMKRGGRRASRKASRKGPCQIAEGADTAAEPH